MILCDRQPRVQFDCALEMLQGFFVPLQYSQQESEFVLNSRRLGIESSGFLPFGKSARCIPACLQLVRMSLDLLKCLLAADACRNHE